MSINLSKAQTIDLRKTSGPQLTRVTMGLGWDGIERKKGMFGFGGGRESVDLDANALLFDEQARLIDAVWFRQLDSRDPARSVRHTGDNRTGEGEGDDESIHVDLQNVPQNVQTIVFTVNNYSGQDFNKVANARCRLIDAVNNTEIASFDLSASGNHTALIMAKLRRNGETWTLTSIGETARGRTYQDNLPDINRFL